MSSLRFKQNKNQIARLELFSLHVVWTLQLIDLHPEAYNTNETPTQEMKGSNVFC
jgi:hypothetical protein